MWDCIFWTFWQSPLNSIILSRQINPSADYAASCNKADEGIFSNEYYNDNLEWTTDLVLGPNVKTILKYMFAGTRIKQLHIPETVENIGVNVIENNDHINAIIFYNDKVRPNVEYGAFGVNEEFLDMVITGPPGNYQYFLFVPYHTKYRSPSSLYHNENDQSNYWAVLSAIMVDDSALDVHQPHVIYKDGSIYLDVPGYEWYRKTL
ncbi:MAG: leucine-rich repeat protein [Bacteroidales bacterium]|nr:leucine-rich repeat protein [Bacteroidales bacterium]